MANTYSQIFLQLVFAVENRESMILEPWRDELYKYITGAIKNQGCKMLAIGGMADHIHILIELSPSMSISALVQNVKIQSSKWVNENRFCNCRFCWQKGYGVFSYTKSHVDQVKNYIYNQQRHHQDKAFREEYIMMLQRLNIEFNEQYLFKPI